MSSKRLPVCLTADIEFEIRGALTYPDRCSPVGAESVWRNVDGKSQGLDPLTEPLAEFGLPATFFIEAMQVAHFGPDSMAAIVNVLKRHPHIDLQLHAHPCWEYLRCPDWRTTVQEIVKNDSMAGRGVAEASAILARAYEYFQQLTEQKPRAFRAGSLRIDGDLLRAQAAVDIPVSSSVGKAYYEPADPALALWSGVVRQGSVTEIPVTSYEVAVPGKSLAKILTITGTPLSTMIRILEHAAANNRGPVVFLTHASEMAADAAGIFEPPRYTALAANQARWRQLCRYLHTHRERFAVLPLGAAAHWAAQAPVSHRPYRGGLADFLAIAIARIRKSV